MVWVIARGIGQVMLQNNALSGALMLAGIFFSSWQMGLLVIGGTVCSTLAAYLMGYSRADIRDGLYGFNGALAAVPLSVAGHWLGMAWGITTLTAPFVVSVWFVWIVRKIGSKRGASFLQ